MTNCCPEYIFPEPNWITVSLLNWSELAAKWQFCVPYLFTICDFHINLLILEIKTWGFFSHSLFLFPLLPELKGENQGKHKAQWSGASSSAALLALCSSWVLLMPVGYRWAAGGRNSSKWPVLSQMNESVGGKRERGGVNLPVCGILYQPERLHLLGKWQLMMEATSSWKEENWENWFWVVVVQHHCIPSISVLKKHLAFCGYIASLCIRLHAYHPPGIGRGWAWRVWRPQIDILLCNISQHKKHWGTQEHWWQLSLWWGDRKSWFMQNAIRQRNPHTPERSGSTSCAGFGGDSSTVVTRTHQSAQNSGDKGTQEEWSPQKKFFLLFHPFCSTAYLLLQ